MKRFSYFIAILYFISCSAKKEHTTWRVTGGSKENIRYSTLTQIETTSIYEVSGKEFLVIACGGGKLKKKSGDSYVAFALK